MSTTKITLNDDVEVALGFREAWALLNDVPLVASCMPGVQLVSEEAEDKWLATMRISVGPISVNFESHVERISADEAERRLEVAFDGREQSGRGTAAARISVELVELEFSRTRLDIETAMELQGAVAEIGAGPLFKDIARQLTRRFGDCLQAKADANTQGVAPGAGAATPAPAVGGLRLIASAIAHRVMARLRKGLRGSVPGRG